jgi:hypothetical protein
MVPILRLIARAINAYVLVITTAIVDRFRDGGVESKTMAQLNPRSFTDSQQLGDAVYELILTNWGNRGVKQDPNNGSIQYPPIKTNPNGSIPIEGMFLLPSIPSLAAIAIAPRSMVDRCVVHYTGLPQTPPALTPGASPSIDDGFVNEGSILESEQILAVGAPLIGQQVGPIIIRAHETSYFSDTYFKSGDSTPSTFGTALPPGPGGALTWTNPELRLLLYMNGRAALPPTQRAPLHVAINSAFIANAEQLAAVVPIMGRKHIRLQYRAAGVGATIRATGVQWNGTPTTGPTFVDDLNFEYPLVPNTVIAADSTAILSVDHPGISFLLLYATPGGPILVERIRVTVDAFD